MSAVDVDVFVAKKSQKATQQQQQQQQQATEPAKTLNFSHLVKFILSQVITL